MSRFARHTQATAPEGSAAVLKRIEERYGFVPNLAAHLAESPASLDAVLGLSEAFDKVSLTPQEQQVVLLAVSVQNDCNYCRTVHTGLAHAAGLDGSAITAILSGRPVDDPRLEALRRFTAALVETRGRVPDQRVAEFLGAGYTRAQVFEVVTGIALKTLTNFSNHLAEAEPNEEFRAMAGAAG